MYTNSQTPVYPRICLAFRLSPKASTLYAKATPQPDDLLQCRAGDRLVAGRGLTSARRQILGAVAAAERPQPVAWLARNLGANRQNVQRIINDLNEQGLVAFEAKLVS